jgi:uncharacterized protein
VPGVELAHNVRTPEEVEAVLIEAERAGGNIVRLAARADGVGSPVLSPIPTGTCGRLPTTPGWTIAEDGSIRI